ncbi:energy transducer TonB [Xanthomonas albilineans]|uniref:energy transducer TonB n=1 Tax=Xanthomonas albilineans TaxID=29447 RepID=UPI0005F309E2|nr:energy transducer TonB [Xanthomonas albilineans]
MPHDTTFARTRRIVAILLLAALTACSKQEEAAPDATPAPTAASAPEMPAASGKVQSMDTEQLQASASQALRENRMYAPVGNNAVEYYLALRGKQPDDAGVKSALTDLMPYTLIAAEQSINREDFAEAQRLIGLIEKMDSQAPALPRLKQGVSKGIQTVQEEAVKAKKAAEQKTKLAIEQQKQAQAQTSQAQVSPKMAEQQEAAHRESARQETPRQLAPSATAAAHQPAAQQQQAATPAPSPTPAPPTASAQTLRPISTPAPRYPPEALRSAIAGEVLVEITVGTDGAVTNARVLRSTPAHVFDHEALSATKRWRFEPVSAPVTTRRTLAFNPGG